MVGDRKRLGFAEVEQIADQRLDQRVHRRQDAGEHGEVGERIRGNCQRTKFSSSILRT